VIAWCAATLIDHGRSLDYGDSHTLEKLGVATQAGQVNMLLISLVDKQ
jgi:hypothetical protein